MQFRRRFIALICLLVLLLVVGCGDDDDNGAVTLNNDDPPDDPEQICEMACNVVYASTSDGGCQQVFQHDSGAVMNEETCVEECLHHDLMRSGELCVATEAECGSQPTEMVDACLPDDYHSPACDHLGTWDHDAVEMEEEVVDLVNELRAEGTNCPGTGAVMPATGPVEMDEELRCASRLHSKDMSDRDFFDHDDPEGVGPAQRADEAGFSGGGVTENIAQGYPTPEAVVEGWRTSDTGHCENMLGSSHSVIGVGYYSTYWTQKFGG